ncbi:MAG: class II aldolase/adducin family protein [Chloroflexi bacterium]|nr:class II aldolase/adducin family protein [Chloroflexota bacterium]
MSEVSDWLGQFQRVGRDLLEMGLVSSHGGNLSVRLQEETVLITRHGCPLGHIAADDLVLLGPEGAAEKEPSLDAPVHLAVYEATDARAVVHAHPRHAIALSLTVPAIEPEDLEGKHYLVTVPVVTAEEVGRALREHLIVMTPGHGSYARGESLEQALRWTSVLEESAQVLWLLRGLGR